MAEPIFVAIVMLARVKGVVWVVFLNIGFERPIVHWLSDLAAEWFLRVERLGN